MESNKNSESRKIKRGIAFSGGGALGAWHVGVLKHKLLEEGVVYDAYAGVSAGALVSSFAAQFLDDEKELAIQELENTMLKISKKQIYHHWNPIDLILDLFKLPAAFVNSKPLQDFIKQSISVEKIRNSSKLLRIGATSFNSGRYEVFTEQAEHLHKAIYASAAVPGLFLPVEIPGKGLWVDGGIRTMTPIASLIDAGCEEIDVCICFPRTSTKYEVNRPNPFNVLFRSIMIMKDQILWGDFRKAELYNELVLTGKHPEKKFIKLTAYSPDRDLSYNVFDFDKDMKEFSDKGFQKARELYLQTEAKKEKEEQQQ